MLVIEWSLLNVWVWDVWLYSDSSGVDKVPDSAFIDSVCPLYVCCVLY